jgi:hypothetical protein
MRESAPAYLAVSGPAVFFPGGWAPVDGRREDRDLAEQAKSALMLLALIKVGCDTSAVSAGDKSSGHLAVA